MRQNYNNRRPNLVQRCPYKDFEIIRISQNTYAACSSHPILLGPACIASTRGRAGSSALILVYWTGSELTFIVLMSERRVEECFNLDRRGPRAAFPARYLFYKTRYSRGRKQNALPECPPRSQRRARPLKTGGALWSWSRRRARPLSNRYAVRRPNMVACDTA